MKKFIVFLLVTFMMIIPFGSVYAADSNTSNKAKRTEFKAQIAAQKEAVKQLRLRNDALRAQIKQKHEAVKATLKVLRKNKDNASKAKLNQVKTALQGISSSKEALKGLKDAGKPYWEALKVNVKNMKLEEAIGNLNSIANVRNSRYDQLVKIDSTLNYILGILQ